MNILLRIAFVGTNYHGFQVQKNALSICEVLQDAMERVLQSRPDVKGCSRTDAGVHARDFCLNFHAEKTPPLEKLPLALNSHLPRDVRVLSARGVPEDFHARYSCTGKEYVYTFRNSPVDDPFTDGFYYRVDGPLDDRAMNAAGAVLVGRHDFASFQAAGSAVTDTVRTVQRLSVARQGEAVRLTIAADGFLYNMVRIIAGSLLLVGRGRWDAQRLCAALAAGDRAAAGDTLPAKGLCLNRVFY